MKDERSTPETATDSDPAVGSFDEVDSFDVELEKRIHEFIADAQPTDGPAPAG